MLTLGLLALQATPELIAQAWDSSKADIVRKGDETLQVSSSDRLGIRTMPCGADMGDAEQAMAQNREKAVGAKEFNDKFASNAETMEFTYKGLPEFLEGVAGALGLAANNIYEGMRLEMCHSEDSKAPFRTSNNGAIQSTPEQEFAFVVDPVVGKEYPGQLRGSAYVAMALHVACQSLTSAVIRREARDPAQVSAARIVRQGC